MSKTKRRNQQKKRRKNGVLLLFVFLMVMAVASWYWFSHEGPTPVISADLLPEIGDASDLRISERAQELADANYFTLQINPEAVFENGRSRGDTTGIDLHRRASTHLPQYKTPIELVGVFFCSQFSAFAVDLLCAPTIASMTSSPFRHDLQPVSVRVFDEVESHGFVLEADASHLFMQLVGRFIIISAEGQMEFLFTDVVLLRVIPQPGQFDLEIIVLAADVHDDEGSVLRDLPALFRQPQRLLIERKRLIQITDIVIFMYHSKLHGIPPC